MRDYDDSSYYEDAHLRQEDRIDELEAQLSAKDTEIARLQSELDAILEYLVKFCNVSPDAEGSVSELTIAILYEALRA